MHVCVCACACACVRAYMHMCVSLGLCMFASSLSHGVCLYLCICVMHHVLRVLLHGFLVVSVCLSVLIGDISLLVLGALCRMDLHICVCL